MPKKTNEPYLREKIRAVRKTRSEWRWLSAFPEKRKPDWEREGKPRGWRSPMNIGTSNDCYLCDMWYTCDLSPCKRCIGCPLKRERDLDCYDNNHPFQKWLQSHYNAMRSPQEESKRSAYANQIVQWCDEWLEQHPYPKR
jgi:hypothetical protein